MKPESVAQLCTKPCMAAVACNNSPWEVEAEGSEVKGHPEASLGYMRPSSISLKTKHCNPQTIREIGLVVQGGKQRLSI